MGIIKLRKGDTLALRAAFTSDQLPYDMSDWTIEVTLQYANCAEIDLVATWDDQPGGIAFITLDEEGTASLNEGEHNLQLRALSPDGDTTSTVPTVVRVRA